MITVRTLKLVIRESDEESRKAKYQFIRDAQRAQYRALNLAMGFLSSAYLKSNKDTKEESYKNAVSSLKNTHPIFNDVEFGRGIDSKSLVNQKVKDDFRIARKNGLARGERNVTCYKRTHPLMTKGRHLNFRYEGDDIVIKWVKAHWKNGIEFNVVTGSKNFKENTVELLTTLDRVINGTYKVCQSELKFDKNNNLMLKLTLNIPNEVSYQPIEGRTLGVDLGIATPAYVCLSDDTYVRKGIGSIEDFLKVRTQFQKRRRVLNQSLVMAKGGKGRKKKLKALNQFKEKERNFAKTYNHRLSHEIVKFAKQHKCEFINLEKLTKEGFNNRILRNWSYYELQSMIEYKAEREGIKVRYVNPAYTSQKCSKCGHVEKANRQTQAQFKCVECEFELHADHNASINIARSEEFVQGTGS